jgi:hypothetical protein
MTRFARSIRALSYTIAAAQRMMIMTTILKGCLTHRISNTAEEIQGFGENRI